MQEIIEFDKELSFESKSVSYANIPLKSSFKLSSPTISCPFLCAFSLISLNLLLYNFDFTSIIPRTLSLTTITKSSTWNNGGIRLS